MASIEKRGSSYRISVSDGRDSQGRQIIRRMTYIPVSRTERKIKDEVKAAARDFEKRVKDGEYYSGETMTFSEVVNQWREEWARKHLADGGAEYMRLISQHALPAFGHMKISKIKPLNIQRIINEEEARGISANTIKKEIAAINSVFRFSYRLEIIKENPCKRCELPKIEQSKALHYFTPDQIQTFFDALEMPYEGDYKQETPLAHRKAFYALAIYTGMRRGELCALTWNDIDYDNCTVNVNKAVGYRRKGGHVIKDPKTAAGIRKLSVPSACMHMLKEWQEQQLELKELMGDEWKGAEDFENQYIFIQRNGTLSDVTGWTNHFKKTILRYNETCTDDSDKLPVIRLHDLRHSSATLLIAAGTDIATVSHRLGHSKISVTLDVYTHSTEENDTKAADTLGELVRLHA